MIKTNGNLSQLERNIKEFEKQLPALSVGNTRRYAVGREGENFKCFDTYRDAIQVGYDLYGCDKEFFVSEVLPTPRVHTITRLLF